MYPKQSAALLSQQFWTTFGKYMAPLLSAEGEKVNWINYKTGVKFIRFIIQSNQHSIAIAIELAQPDIQLQEQQFDQLHQFKKQFEEICGGHWLWQKLIVDKDGKTVSIVVATIDKVNILNQADWPAIISFLKPQLIALDKFWFNFKFALE